MRPKRPRFLRILRVHQRRLVAWIDRHTGDRLVQLIPSWGSSLLLHGAVLLLLALYLYVHSGRRDSGLIEGRFAKQLTEDLTSLVDADHAGDPFTRIKTDEPPSLSLEPAPEDVTTINQPQFPTLPRFAPELASPEMVRERALELPNAKLTPSALTAASAKGLATIVTPFHAEDMTAPFAGRQEAVRAKLVRREGGTVHSERAVENGLDWIVRHQRPDGGWSLNFQGQCKGYGCPAHRSVETESAATGLALLPLLGAGHIHTAKSRYQGNVREGLAWLVSHQQADGDLYVGGSERTQMYSHAIASMALCEAYGLSNDPKLRAPAQRAIDFIVNAQNPATGGWRYAPGQAGDTSVFGWQMFALRSARLSGLKIPRNVAKGCRAYLDEAAADEKKITYAYLPGGPGTPVMTAEALLSRQYLGWPRDLPALVKGTGHIAADLNQSTERNIYYWYYATQLLHNMQNKDWERWNVRVRDGLVAMQMTSAGCERGSWDPFVPQPDRWGTAGGRLFMTSLSVLTLEVYYRYLPLYKPADTDPLKLDTIKDEPAKKDDLAP
jgi:hypothetical protein